MTVVGSGFREHVKKSQEISTEKNKKDSLAQQICSFQPRCITGSKVRLLSQKRPRLNHRASDSYP